MGPPEILAFHLGDAAGGAHRATLEGRVLRYERFRGGFERLHGSTVEPDAKAWAAFARSLDRVDPWGWEPSYGTGEDGDRWSLELLWDGRAIRSSGIGAHPDGFTRLKIALWALLGNPPAL